MATSLVGVPSQPNFVASNCACLLLKKGSNGTVFCSAPMAVPSRLAIASTDFVAAYRVAVECMAVNPAWPGYLQYCCDAGLGQYDLAKIDLRTSVTLADVRRRYKLHPRVDRQIEWLGPLPKA